MSVEHGTVDDLEIAEDGFSFRGNRYRFAEVYHIFLSRVLTIQRLNLVKVGEPESACMSITIADGHELQIMIDESTLFIGVNRNKTRDIQNLLRAYAHIASKTFVYRVPPYLAQIDRLGYFGYDSCRFYPPLKIVFQGRDFPISSTRLLKGNGYVELRPESFSSFDKLIRQFSLRKIPQFNTQTDSDVIFFLLDKLFHITWQPR